MVTLTIPFLALLAAATLTAGATIPGATEPTLQPIPAGSTDGFYKGYLDENGHTVWEFLGADAATVNPNATISSRSAYAPALDSVLVKRDYVSCNGYGINADNANAAQGELADMCGGGYFFSGRSIARVYEDTVAYGCNYSGGQTCHSGDVWNFFAPINAKCGFVHGSQAGAGWY